MSGRAVEASGDVDVLLLDKTGTITLGNRMATEFIPAPNIKPVNAWPTPRNWRRWPTKRPKAAPSWCWPRKNSTCAAAKWRATQAQFVPFTAQTRMSGVDFPAPWTAQPRAASAKARPKPFPSMWTRPAKFRKQVTDGHGGGISRSGGTPLVVAEGRESAGRDATQGHRQRRHQGTVRPAAQNGHPHRHDHRRQQLTAAAIAAEAGVDDFMAQAKPEHKLARIRKEQAGGHLVAMIGDGTNDAPALAQADVGVAMNTGTQAAKRSRQHGGSGQQSPPSSSRSSKSASNCSSRAAR
jgi:potassium-transporting ATPase ATP-binding subunit